MYEDYFDTIQIKEWRNFVSFFMILNLIYEQFDFVQKNVNQESSWEIDHMNTKEDSSGSSAAPWKSEINNGTDLWESNLRGGSSASHPAKPTGPAQPQQPWGNYTPTTSIGGTWGEDDSNENGNMWTGTP